ncbi:MAG: amidohydrolase family protein [Pseudomonadota bacterium]
MHDLVIRNAQIINGTGAPAFSGDVAIDGGRITQVGDKASAAKRDVDASGAILTPGFVDIHTHYDGQLTWDAYLTPSCNHGVTTIVAGNCGVGFAPAKPDKHDWLIDLMEGVEDIPGAALSEGIQWEWDSFPEYLDSIERKQYAMDIGTQVPHGPLRAYVMGERGTDNEEASAEDIHAMAALVREGLSAGALGFSTSRVLIHKSKSGELVPGTFASRDELFGIGKALQDVGHGVFQMTSIHEHVDSEYAWMYDLAKEFGCSIQFNLQQADTDPDQWKGVLAQIEQAHANGLAIYAGMAGRPAGMLYSWKSTLHPFVGYPSYRAIADLPFDEKLTQLRDPAFRSRLLSEKPKDMGPQVNFLTDSYDKYFLLGNPPEYEPEPDTSVAAIAQSTGRHQAEVLYDMMMGEDGTALVYFPVYNYANENFDHLHKLMHSDATVLSLGDGGAHCGFISDASLPTFMLTHWARDRSRGERLSLEFAVSQQTYKTAKVYGLEDRGKIAPGYLADLNIIDMENLHLPAPYFINDLPAKGRRLMQKADGYIATIKSGQVVMSNGEPTGDLPGGLIRGPQSV